MSIAYLWDGERDDISLPGPDRPPAGARPRSPPSTPKALDVRRHPTFRDWTAIAYLAAGIALLVCLADMLR
jgi:hypothetical protein